jgi:hypothetical protein
MRTAVRAALAAGALAAAGFGPGSWTHRPDEGPGPAAGAGTGAPGSAPATAPAGGPSFEALLDGVTVADAAALARRVALHEAGAPGPGSVVAIEIDRVLVAPGPSPRVVVVRVPADLYMVPYATRAGATGKDDARAPVGPLLTAGTPTHIDPPDFAASMTYTLPGAKPAVEVALDFPTADAAAAFRRAHSGHLHAQLVVRMSGAWRATVLDPYTTRTTIDDHGAAKTTHGDKPRRDDVVGAACAVLGHRLVVADGPAAGTVVEATPASEKPRVALLRPPADGDAGASDATDALADAAAPAHAAGAARPGGFDAASATLLTSGTSADWDDRTACLNAHERGDAAGAFVACTRAKEKNPIDAEVDAILKALPHGVPAEAVRAAAAKVGVAVRACGPAGGEPVKVSLLVSTDGAVLDAAPLGVHAKSAVGRCVAAAARAMVLPGFAGTAPTKLTHLFIW